MLQTKTKTKPTMAKQTGDKSDKETSLSITVPYKSPPESVTLDRIQLHIQCCPSNHVEDYLKKQQHPQQQQPKVQFVVILISPKHKLETTQSYLERVIISYLDGLGYDDIGQNQDQNQDQQQPKGKRKSNDIINGGEPICICILFNYRDLLKTNFPSQKELQRSIQEIFEERNVVQQQKVLVDYIDVSLRNCFGLDLLHTFIYKAYLRQKQYDIEKQLYTIQSQIQTTINKNNNQKPPTSYEEFLSIIEPPQSTDRQPQEQQQQ